MAAFLGVMCAVGAGGAWTMALSSIATDLSATGRIAAIAAAVGFVAARATLRPMRFANTLGHELSHAIATLMTGGSVSRLSASHGEGGMVRRRGGWSPFVALAPYLVPWLAVLIAVVNGVYGGGAVSSWGAGAIGTAVGWHVLTTIDGVKRNAGALLRSPGDSGNDFTKMGIGPSIIWIVLGNGVLLGALLAFANGGLGGVTELGVAFWQTEVELWDAVRSAAASAWDVTEGR